jgi:hypothetical protein
MQDKEDRDRSPEGRFKYLAEKRVGKALKALESVCKLSDTKNYSFTRSQVDQIISALSIGLEEVKDVFEHNLEKPSKDFTLK